MGEIEISLLFLLRSQADWPAVLLVLRCWLGRCSSLAVLSVVSGRCAAAAAAAAALSSALALGCSGLLPLPLLLLAALASQPLLSKLARRSQSAAVFELVLPFDELTCCWRSCWRTCSCDNNNQLEPPFSSCSLASSWSAALAGAAPPKAELPATAKSPPVALELEPELASALSSLSGWPADSGAPVAASASLTCDELADSAARPVRKAALGSPSRTPQAPDPDSGRLCWPARPGSLGRSPALGLTALSLGAHRMCLWPRFLASAGLLGVEPARRK